MSDHEICERPNGQVQVNDQSEVFFENRAIPSMIFNELFGKYGVGKVEKLNYSGREYEVAEISIDEKSKGFLGITELKVEKNITRIRLVVWEIKPKNNTSEYDSIACPRNVLEIDCGPIQFGTCFYSTEQDYINVVRLKFDSDRFSATSQVFGLMTAVQSELLEFINHPRHEVVGGFRA